MASAPPSTTYNSAGSTQTQTITASGYYQIDANGAQGGSGDGGNNLGGAGASVGGDIFLQAGDTLEIIVGGQGQPSSGSGGGGGGGSWVFDTTGGGAQNLIEVAGGGGGGGFGHSARGLPGSANSTGNAGGGAEHGVGGVSGGGGGGGAEEGGGGGGGGYGGGGGGGIGLAGNGGAEGGGLGGSGGGGGGAGGYGGGGGGGYSGGGGGGGYGGGGGGGIFGSSGGGGGGSYIISSNDGYATTNVTGSTNTGDGSVTISDDPLCYLAGTLILTPTGQMPVERLVIGDPVVTRFGAIRSIRWIGQQHLAAPLANHAEMAPVRIKAGALAPNVPARDLHISPGHSMLVDDTLILARNLVNGVTITQPERTEDVRYYGIDLGVHDCVIAEGAWSESFADFPGGRDRFDNRDSYAALYPDEPPAAELALCAPRPQAGERLDVALRGIAVRATAAIKPGQLRGFIERIEAPFRIAGWACDADHPELPVLLDIVLDGAVIGRTLACEYRKDLEKAGLGRGYHAFNVNSPVRLDAQSATRIELRRAADGAAIHVTETCGQALGLIPRDAEAPKLRLIA